MASIPSGHEELAFGGAVEVQLSFMKLPADGSAPYLSEGPDEGQNVFDIQLVPLEDVRGEESSYNLGTDAFQVLVGVKSHTTYQTFDSEEEIRRLYYPEVEALLLQTIDGARAVHILGHGVRREKRGDSRQPIQFVHCDHTEDVAARFAREQIDPGHASREPTGRWRIINVWRSLNGTVQTTPMAFASAKSLDANDLFPVEMRYPDHKDWFSGMRYNPTQRWYYWSGMRNDERLLLQCSDNTVATGKQAYHSAFVDERAPTNARVRESIEVRTLVFS